MKSSPLPDPPQFRGRSITPESPRPLHIPEPSNIPVLQNQTDPIFNLMSTHLNPPYASRDMTAMDHELAQLSTSNEAPPTSTNITLKMEENKPDVSWVEGEKGTKSDGDAQVQAQESTQIEHERSESTLSHNQTSSLAEQQSASLASFDILQSSVSVSQPDPPTHSPTTTVVQDTSKPLESPTDPPLPNGQSLAVANPDTAEPTNDETKGSGREESGDTGVNYQTLLDNIVPPSAAEQANDHTQTGNAPASTESIDVPAPSSANPPSATFNAPAGLPPRPPPQEKPAIHPNYVPGEDIRSYHYPHVHHANAQSNHASNSNSYRPPQYPPLASPTVPTTGSNGLPPPPMASFQQQQRPLDSKERSPASQQPLPRDNAGANAVRAAAGSRDDVAPWPPEIQRKYDQFLRDEEAYTGEGSWDKFPQGSRLFVGNLPTEVVTKRDIFHIFHRYGRLAQISIKQAYGFVQFMDTNDCMRALQTEQGGKIKDRNMHLEISKPPKSGRNQGGAGAGDHARGSHYRRRSRSPDHSRRPDSRGMGHRNDRMNRSLPFSDFRDEPRRRDDYRPGRSPSPPHGYRGRDEYRGGRDRSPDRFYGGRRDRSRSPFGRRGGYMKSPSPRRRSLDDDDALPIMRRDPRDVPDVQLILIEDLDRAFVAYVEKAFRDRGLRVAVLMIPNVPIQAVVRRQILEGVQAVVKLYRASRMTGKIPVQVFDRSLGGNNVHFEEYNDLDPQIAAEVVIRSKQKQTLSAMPGQNLYQGVNQPYGGAPYGQPSHQSIQQAPIQPQQPQAMQSQALAAQPNLANLITSLDGPALQKLLSAMQQSPQGQQFGAQQSPGQASDLAALLGSVGQQPPPQGTPTQSNAPNYSFPPGPPHQQQPQQQPQAQGQYGYGTYAQQMPPQQGPPQPQYPQQHYGQPSQQHVQNVMAQLAKYKQ